MATTDRLTDRLPEGWRDTGAYFTAPTGVSFITVDHTGIYTTDAVNLRPDDARALAKRLVEAADLYDSTYARPEEG